MGRRKKQDVNDQFFTDFSERYQDLPKFPQEKRFNIKVNPLTENQKRLMDLLKHKNIIISLGPAGVGKSYIAMAHASKMLALEKYEKLILTRTSIPTGKSLGFFPGTITEKLTPWLTQYISYLKTFLGNSTVDIWLKERQNKPEKIILQPLETVRGMSWENAIVLVEEAQNLTWSEILMLSTRIHDNSLLIFSGDIRQRDIANSGIETLLNLAKKYDIEGIGVVNFTSEDIVRSPLVKAIIQAVEEEGL